MISLSEKEEFLNNIFILNKRLENSELSKIIIHEIGHCFDIKNDFELNCSFVSNLFEMINFYNSLSRKEKNQSEKNALAYEIILSNLLNRPTDFDIKTFIHMNYKFETFEAPLEIYDEVYLMVKNLSFDIQKELFLFAKDTISKWANSPLGKVFLCTIDGEPIKRTELKTIHNYPEGLPFRPNEMFYNSNCNEEYYSDNHIAKIGGRP